MNSEVCDEKTSWKVLDVHVEQNNSKYAQSIPQKKLIFPFNCTIMSNEQMIPNIYLMLLLLTMKILYNVINVQTLKVQNKRFT